MIYSYDFKKQVVDYFLANGIDAAMQKFNLNRYTIYSWRRILIGAKWEWKGKSMGDKSEEIISFYQTHSVSETCKEYSIGRTKLREMLRQNNVALKFVKNQYSYEQKREVIAYADEHGQRAAFKKYGVRGQLISKWKKILGVPATVRRGRGHVPSYREDVKKFLLEEARVFGYTYVSLKYDVSINVMRVWEKQYKICGTKLVRADDATKRAAVEYSYAHTIAAAATEFGYSDQTIRNWRRELAMGIEK